MKTKYLFFLLTLFAFTCQTDNDTPENEIHFVDVDPDIDMQSVRAFVKDPNALSDGCPKIPVPADSSIVYVLDLTNDQSPDFSIWVEHSYEGYCGKCRYSTYSITITGLRDGHLVAKSDSEFPIARIFEHTDTVNEYNTWIDQGDILLIDGCSSPYNTDFEEGYVGLKVNDTYGYIHIAPSSNHGITIMDYAYNASKNKAICCGQQE